LTTPGGFAAIFEEFPPVIRDAIEFTKRLGEKYIWIDSLCIVQDDDEVKSKLISKMNLVYKHAFLTLFAATGEDANAGLPGLRPGTRHRKQAIASIGPGLDLVYPLSHANLGRSAWASRGWTYVRRVDAVCILLTVVGFKNITLQGADSSSTTVSYTSDAARVVGEKISRLRLSGLKLTNSTSVKVSTANWKNGSRSEMSKISSGVIMLIEPVCRPT
jgi:hypothetical protein